MLDAFELPLSVESRLVSQLFLPTFESESESVSEIMQITSLQSCQFKERKRSHYPSVEASKAFPFLLVFFSIFLCNRFLGLGIGIGIHTVP